MSENQNSNLSSSYHLPRLVESTACGKAIIVGEHAAVYGAHAVAIPLKQMRFRFSMKSVGLSGEARPDIQLKMGGHGVSQRIQAVVLKAMQMFGAPFSLHAESHSSLPIGAGLGSSATLCVAVLRALSHSLGRTLTQAQLADWANELEKSFHGNPSGLDTAVVAYEECILFAKGKVPQPLHIPSSSRNLEFVLIDSNIRASTLAMIRIAQPYFQGAKGDRHLRAFDDLSLAAHRALQEGRAFDLGETMHACSSLLLAAGVVPDSLQDMIEQARNLGLLGVKTTGAGGGGMILGLLDPAHADAQYRSVVEHFSDYPVYRASLDSSSFG